MYIYIYLIYIYIYIILDIMCIYIYTLPLSNVCLLQEYGPNAMSIEKNGPKWNKTDVGEFLN